ncbi:MAG: hypothetical protein RMM28_10445, partial [Thermoleophilia bacterium]|nr:hypothetical protein [Thermoleophilia bacterium]
PLVALGERTSPGLLVVSARAQVVGQEQLIASDFAPESGRIRWSISERTVASDAEGDHDAAPDLETVRVSDARDGWVRFLIATPNRPALPSRSAVVLSIDTDGRLATGDAGAELTFSTFAGEVLLQRWNARRQRWEIARPPARIRARSGGGTVTMEIHRRELGDVSRFGFRLVSADFNLATGGLVAVDFAPDNGLFWSYALARAAFRLVAGRTTASPTPPVRGQAMTIRTPVTRSDTRRGITSGTVACDVRSGATRVPARGSVRGGAGLCALLVPRDAISIGGSMTIRSVGAEVRARFRFRVG